MTPTEASSFRLGGGTALAMRWEHRVSTDIDYAMERRLVLAFINRTRLDLGRALRTRKMSGELKRFRVGQRTLTWECRDTGPVSLSASDLPQQPDLDWEEETRIAIAPSKDILRGKLFGRVLDNGRLVTRDGYDLSAAFRHAPEAITDLVREARAIRTEDFQNICDLIMGTPRRIIVGRPLMHCIHKDLAHDPWRHFVKMADSVPDLPPQVPLAT